MKRCLILVEGQTEERFVKDVLYPEFVPRSLYLYPTILTTRVVKSGSDFKGGITTYAKLRGDLYKLLNDTGALVTTMIDYYGLPADFPGMSTRPKGSAIDRVRHVERSIFLDVGSPRHLTPFLLLHEFEALLFTNTEVTASTIPARDRAPELFAVARGQAPEDINEDPATAPSKRIRQVFPSFKKTLHGPTAAKRIGLPAIRACCPHFDAWLTRLEDFATS
jgi:Domain of unknown function (DUF4276)